MNNATQPLTHNNVFYSRLTAAVQHLQFSTEQSLIAHLTVFPVQSLEGLQVF